MPELKPTQIVSELDKYIIGQADAKRAVAIAVRNRWRRQRLAPEVAREIAPRNIVMVGPTGVGKTEIARRLARLVQAPFIKVEATKYTEVGYHGRDVESMIRDLLDLAINMVRSEQAETVKAKAEEAAELRLVAVLLGEDATVARPHRKSGGWVDAQESELGAAPEPDDSNPGRERMLEKVREGFFDEKTVEISVTEKQGMPMMGGMGADQLDPGMTAMIENLMPQRHKTRKVPVTEARRIFIEEETEKLIDRESLIEDAIERTEQSGMIFLDEIDKLVASSEGRGSADVSRQGVQRDLLPIVEGSAVATRHGIVNTDHILFIAAGAFHSAAPSDLMPELQGRFPIRVELSALTRDDFVRILREPEHSLLKQQQALLGTEGLEISFEDDAIDLMADLAARANATMENIGARRLMTIVEKLFEGVSYDAPERADRAETSIVVDAAMVESELGKIIADDDLSRFVL